MRRIELEKHKSTSRLAMTWKTIQRLLLEPRAVGLQVEQRVKESMLSAFLLLIVLATVVQSLDPNVHEIRRI